jgi:hypothetical protein
MLVGDREDCDRFVIAASVYIIRQRCGSTEGTETGTYLSISSSRAISLTGL